MDTKSPQLRSVNPALTSKARQLPCDGVGRFSVGRNSGLTYSQAYEAILAEETFSFDGEGKRILKRGGTARLARLNALYEPLARHTVRDRLVAGEPAGLNPAQTPTPSPAEPKTEPAEAAKDPRPIGQRVLEAVRANPHEGSGFYATRTGEPVKAVSAALARLAKSGKVERIIATGGAYIYRLPTVSHEQA